MFRSKSWAQSVLAAGSSCRCDTCKLGLWGYIGDMRLLKMDEKSTMSRIEKLFPHDDLELNSSGLNKPRRRRSAPSQILLKNFRRSATVVDVSNTRLALSPTAAVGGVSSTPAPDYVSRKFIFESAVQLTVGVQTQERYLFLFNDLLFIAKQRSATSYKLKKRVLVSDIWLSNNVSEVTDVSNIDPTKSFVIGWPTTNCVATFATKELCERWKEKLSNQVNEELNKEVANVLDAEVVFTTSDTVTQVLAVEKHTDARELLQRALESFGLENPKDIDGYQLWVLSTKDDSIYPLFGHEQPFAIQLSHERDPEDLDPNVKCQFILRENKKQMKLDNRKPQKSTKKRRLPLSSIFRKASGKVPSSPRSNSITEGKIFGHPLDQICDPDVPGPLMELLDYLYNYGPFTTEIFRKPPNSKKCQEMVNHMNSTEPDGWCKGCRNGILFASILKTFLRELPGKLCCSDFYNQWSNSIGQPKYEDQLHGIQRVIEKMPKGNQLILRYIICILYNIHKKSDHNKMTSYNLAVCIGPSLLWNESEQEASSKTVPHIVQFLVDNCEAVFGEDVLNMFGHPPIPPPDSDTEELERVDRIHTPYGYSLESLSDTEEPPVMGGLTQMSPSSCSRDSGLILSDPHEDGGNQSDEHSLSRPEIIKSKSCDSLSHSESRNLRTTLAPLQTQVSSDSLDCDDEYVELVDHTHTDYNFLLTKSRSGSHLCFDRDAEKTPLTQKSNERLKSRLASVVSRYTGQAGLAQDVEYSSSDSDKSVSNTQKGEWPNNDLQKSSTNSSLLQCSSSSDDALAGEVVTHRHINSPKILASESGHHPTDFLHQFNKKIQSEEIQKKRLRELVRMKTEPSITTHTDDTDDDVDQSHRQSGLASRAIFPNHRHGKHTTSGTPRVTRTNTYAGNSKTKAIPADVTMFPSMAEMQPIMPQQYRPNRPPPYREALERKEIIRSGIPEIERMKQTINSARAKQLYHKSVQLFEQQENSQPNSRTTTPSLDSSHSSSSSKANMAVLSNLHLNNNNTIGIVKTDDKKFVIKRASSAKLPPRRQSMQAGDSTSSIFYQPSSGSVYKSSPSNTTLSGSFYRPTQPPPYKEVMKRRTSKPDLIDSLGGESHV